MTIELKRIVSGFFWEIGAIKVSVDKPFQLVSGKFAPVYIDCRMLISYPLQRGIITAYAQWICDQNQLEFDCIAGGETAGIPFAAWLAEKMGKAFIYVRKKPKGYGTTSQLEGKIESGRSVLLYEDLITDGQSKINFIEGIRKAGCRIADCLVLFDRRQGGSRTLADQGVALHSLVSVEDCLQVGEDQNYLSAGEAEIIRDYLDQAGKEEAQQP